ncbi:MAG: DUF262 domain-containing protein [Deltaproteobacteria bacterium]|nr:DUF262 domain-containing protein [Deltaproteobacteria bacterium]
MINPNPSSIGDILNSTSQFAVPNYQREYTWGKNEAIEFFEDLKSYADSGTGNLFLGTLIFDVSEKNKNSIKVVDGQQRITTILLFLIACRNVAKQINANNLATLIQNKITFTDPTTAESRGCRLIASVKIKDVFEDIASDFNWDGTFSPKPGKKPFKWQVNLIKPIYDYFYDEIKSFNQTDLSKFLKAIYEAYVVRIDIEDELEAFSIFERTNARGVDLEASDLLKNYLFQQGVDGLEEIWPQVVESSDRTLLRMLKYFYVARKGYVTKSDLYKKLRIYGTNIGPFNLVKEIDDFSKFYSAIRTAGRAEIKDYFDSIGCSAIACDQDKYEEIYLALEGLRLFKIAQIYPLLYAAISCFIRDGGGDNQSLSKKLIQMFDMMEKYHFINTAICERMGNEVEKLYATYCEKYADKDSKFEKTTKELMHSLKGKLATENEFAARFVELSYSAESIPLISYIFDRINNVDRKPGQRLIICPSREKRLQLKAL